MQIYYRQRETQIPGNFIFKKQRKGEIYELKKLGSRSYATYLTFYFLYSCVLVIKSMSMEGQIFINDLETCSSDSSSQCC